MTPDSVVCLLPPPEKLPDSEKVHRWFAGTLRHQRHLRRQAVQQSALQKERQVRPQEPGLGRLPAPEPALLPHPPQLGTQGPSLPRQRSPQQPRHPGHEAQVHLSVLPGLDRCLLRDAPGSSSSSSSPTSASHPSASPQGEQPAGRHPAPPIPPFLLSVYHHVPGTLSDYQVSDTVDAKTSF